MSDSPIEMCGWQFLWEAVVCREEAFALYLVIQWELTERWDIFCPFNQHQKLLFHRFTHIVDGSHFLHGNVRAVHWTQ